MSLGLYIHIPFCSSKCHYCNFNSAPIQSDLQLQGYVENLIQEINQRLMGDVDTIYFGGGTPSLCEVQQIASIMSTISKQCCIKQQAEITLEANPGTINQKKLMEFKHLGINRLSIGIQSLNDHFLKLLGRIHTAQEARQTLEIARKVGFNNCSCDLISGLPNQSLKEFKEDLEQIIQMKPEHISIYDLSIEEHTVLERQIKSGQLSLPDEDIGADMVERTNRRLQKSGYVHYEISNYAKPGFESRHNLKYWTDQDYMGIGCGAHSYMQGKRFWNVKQVDDYNQLLHSGQSAIENQEILKGSKKMAEYIIMGLRLTKGIKRKELNQKFGNLWEERFSQVIKGNIDKGLLEMNERVIKLTKLGRLLGNMVFREFL